MTALIALCCLGPLTPAQLAGRLDVTLAQAVRSLESLRSRGCATIVRFEGGRPRPVSALWDITETGRGEFAWMYGPDRKLDWLCLGNERSRPR